MDEQKRGENSRLKSARAVRPALSGGILGLLCWWTAAGMGFIGLLPAAINDYGLWIGLAGGAALGVTRGRVLLWIAAAGLILTRLFIVNTPFAGRWLQDVIWVDPLDAGSRADAVVVLATGIFPDGHLPLGQQNRLLHGYELVRSGFAPRMIVTRLAGANPSSVPVVHRQLKALRAELPVMEVGPVANTRDEAEAVARLARERGWRRVIVVTDYSHTRRAAATFRKSGLDALASAPPNAGDFDVRQPGSADERMLAFRSWMREAIALRVYRARGWL